MGEKIEWNQSKKKPLACELGRRFAASKPCYSGWRSNSLSMEVLPGSSRVPSTSSNQPKRQAARQMDCLRNYRYKLLNHQTHILFTSKAQVEGWMGPPRRPRTVFIDEQGPVETWVGKLQSRASSV
jgi:hypothetical protein